MARRKNTEATRKAFLAVRPGLEAALQTNHRIINDIRERFLQWGDLSDKQVALVLKIAKEIATRPAEKTVSAPVTEDRITFVAKVVSAKMMESQYGLQNKMTVKVETPEGVWLAWGTVPAALVDSLPHTVSMTEYPRPKLETLRGATVEITAGLKPGREAHFAILARPVAKLVSLAPVEAPVVVREEVAPVVAVVPAVAEVEAELAQEPRDPGTIEF